MLARLRSVADLQFLREILEDDEWLRAVAEASYRHALGFDKVIVLSLRPLGQLRVHVWWPEPSRVQEHVHNHRFWFASRLVLGKLRTHVLRTGTGSEFSVLGEDAAPQEARWTFVDQGMQLAEEVFVATLQAGDEYVTHPDLLHRVSVGADELVVTLFWESETTKPKTCILVAEGQQLPESRSQTRFTQAELKAKLGAILTGLHDSSAGR
jgi:hypothetical protein